MATCTGDSFVQSIDRTECIGNSLIKINNNFATLDTALCEASDVTTTITSVSGILKSNGSGTITAAVPAVDYATPSSVSKFTFVPRVVLASGGPYTTSGTVASGTISLSSFSGYSTANVVQLYVKIFTNDGSPSGTYWSYLNLSVGSESYGNVLAHSFSTNGSLPQVSQAYLLVNTSLSKSITYSLSLATATVGGISFEITAVGKF